MLFGAPRVCTADPVALNYILSHHDSFPKPELTRRFLTDLLGSGVLVAEGTAHRRQRRVLNPSFSPQSIRDVLPVFYDKAIELREKLLGIIEEDTNGDAAPSPMQESDRVLGGRKIDVMKFLGQCTIDVIGIAGFDYDFKALSQPKNELADSFNAIFSAGANFSAMSIIQTFVPGASRIVSPPKTSLGALLISPAD
jgi:cytochrome P450